MEYQTFKEQVLAGLRKEVGEEREISIHQVERNNGVFMEAVVLLGKEDKLAPTIYLKEFYEFYKNGMAMEEVIQRILELEREEGEGADFSLDSFENYEKARKRIFYKLVNYKMNQAALEKTPHMKYLDLAIVFYYRLEEGALEGATILIRHCNLKTWGVEISQVFEDAAANTYKKLPYLFQGMEALIAELAGEEELLTEGEEVMYVLTNEEKYYGAAAILYPRLLEHIGKILKSDFYILPSSIHECILVPDSGRYSRRELLDMVQEVNESQVEKEEILSYEVYYYDRKKEALIL